MDGHEDPAAVFERLFEAHYWAVRSYVLRRAPSAAVEDVVAETFWVAWRRPDAVRMIRCPGCSGSLVVCWQTSTAPTVAEAR
jgi:DNA-directed RNA polymerase specialized sigma24 family protein